MQTPDTGVLILRLMLAGFLGGLIGAEREYRAKVAGMRTHLLVAIGAALMLIVSRYGFDGQGDPSRVAAQIVSGIGFIGAGAIMVQRHAVHGLTTAAGIWVAAGIGMLPVQRVEAAHVVETRHVVHVRVGEDDGVDVHDAEFQTRQTELRRRVHHERRLPGAHIKTRPAAPVAHVGRGASGTPAADLGNAHARAGAEELERQAHFSSL